MITTILEVSRQLSLTGKISEGMPALSGPSPHEAANLHAERRSLFCQSDKADFRSLAEAALPNLFWA
jgi:hypothetical protein